MIPRVFSFSGGLPDEYRRGGGPGQAGRGPLMIPYADFLYFGILLYIALPTLLIRRLLGFSRAWVLLATAAMLVVQYGTVVHFLPMTAPPRASGPSAVTRSPGGSGKSGRIWVVLGCALFQWAVAQELPVPEDAHAPVLAVSVAGAVEPCSPWSRPDSRRWPSPILPRVRGDLVPDVPQPGRHLRHPGPADRRPARRPVLRVPPVLPHDLVGTHRPLPTVRRGLESPPTPGGILEGPRRGRPPRLHGLPV